MADEAQVFAMPKLGETVTEGTIGHWLKAVGETVAFDEALVEVSTDKVDTEIPSPYDGTILEILVGEEETVDVGTPLARIGTPGAVPAAAPAPAAEAAPAPAAAPAAAAPAAAGAAPADAGGQAEVFAMPKLGETVTEGTIGHWLKAVGETVAFDEALVEVSTDKVDTEIPSPYDGTILEILVGEGETVDVGTPLARIGTPGAVPAAAPAAPATVPALAPSATSATVPSVATPAIIPAARPDMGNGQRALLSPMVRRLAAEHNIDLAAVPGSGSGGRIMREDVERAIAARAATPSAARPAPPVAAPSSPVAAPAPAAAPSAPATRAAAPVAGDREEVVPLSRIRLVTAQRMLESRQTSPHVWTSVEVDLERVEQIRQQHKTQFRKDEGASLTYLTFIARATCDALRAFPAVNSSVHMASKTMTFHRYVNLAIAVDLNEQGLVAPVIKNADALNLRGLARAIKAAGDGAKARKLGADDMSGSTFTITNPGPLASYASAAVINQPNVAIMSTEGVARRPTAVGDAIAIHHMCILGLSYDHRAFDGVTASRFLLFIRDALQDRNWEAELG
jgi:2-oxoglutarate dehydrogenase E2 component (dihydrolipoamide succinyltransferase)